MQYVKAKEVVCKYLLSTLKLLVFSSSLVREWLHDQSAWYVSKFNERDCIWFMDHIPPQALPVHTVKSIYQTYWHINWCLWMDDFSFPWNTPSLVWDPLVWKWWIYLSTLLVKTHIVLCLGCTSHLLRNIPTYIAVDPPHHCFQWIPALTIAVHWQKIWKELFKSRQAEALLLFLETERRKKKCPFLPFEKTLLCWVPISWTERTFLFTMGAVI